MADIPAPLTYDMLDGSERIRVGRRMMDADRVRTGPVKVWTTSVADIIKYARRISPTLKGIAINDQGVLTFTNTNDEVIEVGKVSDNGEMISIAGPPGPPGPTGSQGPEGPQGSPGRDGTTERTARTAQTAPRANRAILAKAVRMA